jgi:hypothetical protein
MSLSQTWALIRAFFTPTQTKGAFNLEPTNDAPGAAPAALVADASTVVIGAGTADATAAVALASAIGAPAAIAGTALALPGTLVAAAAPGAVDSDAAAALDPDDEDEAGAELESLKAISGGGVDLFVTVLKDLVAFALDLGHDFDAAYDKSVERAKALAAKL